MTDFTMMQKIKKVRELQQLLNSAILDLVADQDAGFIKVEVDVRDMQSVGRRFPHPLISVKVAEIKDL